MGFTDLTTTDELLSPLKIHGNHYPYIINIIYIILYIYAYYIIYMHIIPGWWYTYPSVKYEFVSWDDDSQYMEK